MNVYTRGVRNAFRNSIRTFSIVTILGLSVGLALTMLVARQAVEDKITEVKASVGNTISVSPAGVQGFQGGGDPLTVSQLSTINNITHVTKVTEKLDDRLTTDTTNLQTAIEAGSLGQRRAGDSGLHIEMLPPPSGASGSTSTGTSGQTTTTFTPPIIVTGVNDLSSASVYGGDTVSYTSGKALDPTKDVNEAVVGKALAEKNNLSVGSTFTAYGETIKVVGIYDTGSTFSNAGLIMSLASLQRLSGQSGSVTSATITVDSLDNIDSVTSSVKSKLGDKADVTNEQENAKQTVQPLENVKTIAMFSLIGALVAGAVIILLTMMMIVRERRREIGVMKAIGSSNTKTMLQFMSESVTLTLLGLVVGLIVGIAAANPVTKVLVTNSTDSSTNSQVSPGAGPRMRLERLGSNSLRNVKNIQASVGWDILAYGAGAAVVIAIVGSAVPAYFISKVRPAEVMRAE
ncbi:MAG TPA: FtsX-like permease family protein [Candidatus Saccharimonadales bacterium]|nr:FtsX-like permease family protein [Candidatus Saccharimonadales bacterium]